jgi:hypothetical protein
MRTEVPQDAVSPFGVQPPEVILAAISDEASGSKRAMFSATLPANSSMSCGR